MAEAYKINFYPKPTPPANPRVKSYNKIQRLLAKGPTPPTHEPGRLDTQALEYNGPKKTALQRPDCGAHQFR